MKKENFVNPKASSTNFVLNEIEENKPKDEEKVDEDNIENEVPRFSSSLSEEINETNTNEENVGKSKVKLCFA